jgi:hypothetical protein
MKKEGKTFIMSANAKQSACVFILIHLWLEEKRRAAGLGGG